MKTTWAEFPRDLSDEEAFSPQELQCWTVNLLTLKKNVESIQIVEPQKAVNVRNTHNCLGMVHLALDNMCSPIKLNCSICSTQTLNVNTPHFMPKVLRLALNHLYLMFSQCRNSHIHALILALEQVVNNMLLFHRKYAETEFNTDI